MKKSQKFFRVLFLVVASLFAVGGLSSGVWAEYVQENSIKGSLPTPTGYKVGESAGAEAVQKNRDYQQHVADINSGEAFKPGYVPPGTAGGETNTAGTNANSESLGNGIQGSLPALGSEAKDSTAAGYTEGDLGNGLQAPASSNSAAKAAGAAPSGSAGGAGGSELTKKTFMFDPNKLAPTTKKYRSGTANIPILLDTVAKVLLIVVSTGAVLFIVVGGLLMATSGGDSERANKGKIIITYNIIAIIIAMLSFGIVQFVIWVIGA